MMQEDGVHKALKCVKNNKTTKILSFPVGLTSKKLMFVPAYKSLFSRKIY
jgi:hypothetical protein